MFHLETRAYLYHILQISFFKNISLKVSSADIGQKFKKGGGDSFVIKRRGMIEANTIKILMTGA